MSSQVGVELRMNRSLEAPIQTVFDALTSQDAVGRWFGPSDTFEVIVHEWDCRVGGRYRVEFDTPEGEVHVVVGEFRSLEPNRKVAYTWTWEGQPHMDSLVTFLLEAGEAGRTELTFAHEGFPSPEVRGHHEQGWTGSLERLQRVVVKTP